MALLTEAVESVLHVGPYSAVVLFCAIFASAATWFDSPFFLMVAMAVGGGLLLTLITNDVRPRADESLPADADDPPRDDVPEELPDE